MVTILFTVSAAEGGRAAWLEDMLVHPDRRGQGIGWQLLSHALAEARIAGCTRITLLTDGESQHAMPKCAPLSDIRYKRPHGPAYEIVNLAPPLGDR